MRRMRLIILVLAIGSAVMAGIMAKGMMGGKSKTEVVEVNKVPMSEILVAAKDLAMGERLATGNVRWREWPKANVADSMITKDEMPDAIDKLQTARARLPLFDGEPIVEKKLCPASALLRQIG
ncbi:MAG: hypothetical protein FJX63_01435 [Alphaproteobacteria bacterium]|nr:hypothetical protein [Alphaproteobacteria bacterium]